MKAPSKKATKGNPLASMIEHLAKGPVLERPEGKRQHLASELKATPRGLVVKETNAVAASNGILTGEGRVICQCPNLNGIPMSVEFIGIAPSGLLKWANHLLLAPSKIEPAWGRNVGAVRLHSQGDPVRDEKHAGKLAACEYRDGTLRVVTSTDLPESGDVNAWVKSIKHLAKAAKASEDHPIWITVPRRFN